MMDRAIAFVGAIGIYWLKAENLIADHPRLTLILWFCSFVAGVWL